MKKYNGVACLTIVSKNYISCARVLCDSFLDSHPGAKFFVVLVDKNNGYINPDNERFNLLEMSDVGIPRPDIFPYQYNILELNTAVKPFALKFLLEEHSFQKITYIDPDIMVLNPLDGVWDNLEKNSVVLTPHMREPFDDGRHPSELGIIQSGTYNLGFIGLKNGDEAIKLLSWWSERLYLDCVVDVPRGLFTDQKWIDLVPAYFESTYILRDPSYNIAYWNIHERELVKKGEEYFVDGNPLAFFHFSGYDPRKPKVLSKHQDRHDLANYPDLSDLFSLYGEKLFEADLKATKKWPYAFKQLSNGVEVTDAMSLVVRECLRKHIVFPSPTENPDDFCDFLMTPNRNIWGENIAPFISALLRKRPDIHNAFPDALTNKESPGLWDWVENNRNEGWKFTGIFNGRRKTLAVSGSQIEKVANVYFSRSDLTEAFPCVFKSTKDTGSFCDWLLEHGELEYDWLTAGYADRFTNSVAGAYKVIALYFSREDLQNTFRSIFTEAGIEAFLAWLYANVTSLPNLSEDEIDFFSIWVKLNSDKVMKACLIYSNYYRGQIGGLPSVFNVDEIVATLRESGAFVSKDDITKWLVEEYEAEPLEHLLAYYYSRPSLIRRYPLSNLGEGSLTTLLTGVDQDGLLDTLESNWLYDLKESIKRESWEDRVNVAGYFDAATGMGQAARSVRLVMAEKYVVNSYTLPLIYTDRADLDFECCGKFFGKAKLAVSKSIVVANADSVQSANKQFPTDYVFGKKVGYWLWETESLPAVWKNSDRYYDEIWTASEYCKEAIEKTVTKPVRSVPLCLDFSEFDEVNIGRTELDLPEDGFLVGYFFDPKSIFERKNPKAVIDAFKSGLGNDQNAYLIMKINNPLPGLFGYEQLKQYSKGLNVIWLEKTLSRRKTLELMSCLDVYVSLHRSEGFGLTMAESMALGIPTIATNYSSNVEFMEEGAACLVSATIIESKKAYGPYLKGTRWAEPSIAQAAEWLADLREGECSLRNIKESIRRVLSPSIISEKI